MPKTYFADVEGRDLEEKLGEHPSVKDIGPLGFGAVGDGQFVNDCAMQAGGFVLSSLAGKFRDVDKGKPITVDGAGAGGSILKTFIASYTSATSVTLRDAAVTGIVGEQKLYAWWGTDDSAAINAAIASLANSFYGCGELYFPAGIYMLSAPIQCRTRVTLLGVHGWVRYGFDPTQALLPVVLKTSSQFPPGGFVLDARQGAGLPAQVGKCGFHFIEVIGDGSSNLQQFDATTTGVGFGSCGNDPAGVPLSDQNPDAVPSGHQMVGCSFTLNKRNVWAKLAGSFEWIGNNFASAWYISVDFEKYAGNDGSYVGNYINSNNWVLNGRAGTSLLDVYTGVGLRLGYGCAYQTWQGGKIEYCGTGVLLDHGSFGNNFDSVRFDANAKWAARIRGTIQIDDLLTINNLFHGCYFNGSSNQADLILAGLNAHVLMEGEISSPPPIPPALQAPGYYPVRVQAGFDGCRFKSSLYGQISELSLEYPKAPSQNLIATLVNGPPGPGAPVFDLSITDCDCVEGAVKNGYCTTATGAPGTTTVTWVAGDPSMPQTAGGRPQTIGDKFDTAWVGKTFWHYWFNRFTIKSVESATSLTLTSDIGANAKLPWYVEVNAVRIDANASGYSNFKFLGNKGLPDYVRQSSADKQVISHIANSSGTDVSTVASNGDTWMSAAATATFANLVISRDTASVLFIGRYDNIYLGAVLDFASPDGISNPTLASIRLAGAQKILLGAGVTITAALVINNGLTVKGIAEIARDLSGLLYVGRYDAGGTAVIDFASLDGLNAPTIGSIRLGGVEKIQVNAAGATIPNLTLSNAKVSGYIAIVKDTSGLLYVGRYDAGGLGIIDFADYLGVAANGPSVANLRIRGNAFLAVAIAGALPGTIDTGAFEFYSQGLVTTTAFTGVGTGRTPVAGENFGVLGSMRLNGAITLPAGTASMPMSLNASKAVQFIPLTLAMGGTGGTDAPSARTSLSVYSKAEVDALIALQVTKVAYDAHVHTVTVGSHTHGGVTTGAGSTATGGGETDTTSVHTP